MSEDYILCRLKSSGLFLKGCTTVTPLDIVLFGGEISIQHEKKVSCISFAFVSDLPW